MIHIGDKWGHKYDLTIDFLKRFKYFIKTGIFLPYHSEMLDRIYEQFPEFLPNSNDVVYDIGAQYGDYSIICSKIYGVEKVYAWEPLKQNYKKFDHFIKINNIYGFDIESYSFALSDRNESIQIRHNGMLNKSNIGDIEEYIMFRVLDDISRMEKSEFPPSALIKIGVGIKLPTLMKIDVEGYEMKVLMGALRIIGMARPRIIIETHTIELENEVRAFFKNLNYNEPKEYRRIKNKDGNEFVNLFFMPMEE